MNHTKRWVLSLILGAVVIGGLTWVNFVYVKTNPRAGNFLVQYIGTRSLLIERVSPYSDEVSERILNAPFGHSDEVEERETAFDYPLYSILIFAPFSLLKNFHLTRAIWMTALELALVAMTFIGLDNADWKPNLILQGVLLLFSITWYHAARAVTNGNAAILVALFITVSLNLIKKNNDRIAGMLLAFTTIKPLLVVVLIPYMILWAIYQKRWSLISGFFTTLATLVIIGITIIPNWILQNIWEILKSAEINPVNTLALVIAEWVPGVEEKLKWGIFLGLGILLLIEWWTGREGSYKRYLWTASLTLVVSQWIGIQADPNNFIVLFPVLILILSVWNKRWEGQGTLIVGTILTILFIGLWALVILTTNLSHSLQVQNTLLFFPVPIILIIGLYWIKWWVLTPGRSLWEGER